MRYISEENLQKWFEEYVLPDYSGLYAHALVGLEDYWIDIPSNTAKVDYSTYGIGDNYTFAEDKLALED